MMVGEGGEERGSHHTRGEQEEEGSCRDREEQKDEKREVEECGGVWRWKWMVVGGEEVNYTKMEEEESCRKEGGTDERSVEEEDEGCGEVYDGRREEEELGGD